MTGLADTIRSRLLSISIAERVAYQNVQTMFLLERMVARLTRETHLFEHIVFKGGYVALRAFHSPRYTMDLDAIVSDADLEAIGTVAITAIEATSDDGVWFRYERTAELQTLGEYGGIRYFFRGGIGEMPEKYLKAQSLHLDLATGDVVVPAPEVRMLAALVGEQSLTWKTYTIESAAAEKLHTLLVRGSDNSRSKDVYDLHRFLPQCRMPVLKEALAATFSARGDQLPERLTPAVRAIDLTLLKKGWKNMTAGLTSSVPLDEAFTVVVKYCRTLDDMR
ncbi:MAG TPA: nucleotidyl transferase AbiEii/AbiGii toxin family protein [bacterium]|nr:nucleotidyl transferase AbiEii/AbiGii toxin family protein [bacterium]